VTEPSVVVDDEDKLDEDEVEIPDRTVNARRLAREAHFANRIRKLLAGAPALTQDQRDRLALLLRGIP
jgi:hypothetical protein